MRAGRGSNLSSAPSSASGAAGRTAPAAAAGRKAAVAPAGRAAGGPATFGQAAMPKLSAHLYETGFHPALQSLSIKTGGLPLEEGLREGGLGAHTNSLSRVRTLSSPTMSLYFLPSELDRIVLGFLEARGHLAQTCQAFVRESPSLAELAQLRQRRGNQGAEVMSLPAGKGLVEMLDEYAQ